MMNHPYEVIGGLHVPTSGWPARQHLLLATRLLPRCRAAGKARGQRMRADRIEERLDLATLAGGPRRGR